MVTADSLYAMMTKKPVVDERPIGLDSEVRFCNDLGDAERLLKSQEYIASVASLYTTAEEIKEKAKGPGGTSFKTILDHDLGDPRLVEVSFGLDYQNPGQDMDHSLIHNTCVNYHFKGNKGMATLKIYPFTSRVSYGQVEDNTLNAIIEPHICEGQSVPRK
jgi:hypothetical protein